MWTANLGQITGAINNATCGRIYGAKYHTIHLTIQRYGDQSRGTGAKVVETTLANDEISGVVDCAIYPTVSITIHGTKYLSTWRLSISS